MGMMPLWFVDCLHVLHVLTRAYMNLQFQASCECCVNSHASTVDMQASLQSCGLAILYKWSLGWCMAKYLHVVQRKYTKSAMLHRGHTTSMAVVMFNRNGEWCFCVFTATPDLVPRRLYNVMSPDPLYPRQGSSQGVIPATTSQTYHTPIPHTTGPRPTTVDTPDGWIRDVTSDGDVEPNPGPSPLAPSAKRTRYNQDTPLTYQTPRMLRKRTTDNTPPGHKRGRTDHLHMADQEHQSPTLVCNHHKRKAEGEPSHQPTSKRHQSTTHWDEQHPPGNQGNLRPKRTFEDTTEHVMSDSPRRKIRRTQRLCRRPYPRPTSWVHDPTQDGDTEPNPGPATPAVERAAQTTPAGDMGTEVDNALLPLLLAAPPPRQPDDAVHKHAGYTNDGE